MKHSLFSAYSGFLVPSVAAVCSVGVCYAQYSDSVVELFNQGVEYYQSYEYEKAVAYFRKAAEQGLAEAQNNLGLCYDNGEGVTQNDKEAAKWYRKAAEQGFASAQNNLGFRYETGKGVTQNDKEAAKWYRKAAEQGHA